MLQKRVNKEGNHFRSYVWKVFKCELCKAFLPFSWTHEGTIIDLLEYEVPTGFSYFVIESITSSPLVKFLHVIIPPATRGVMFGKSHNCDVIIPDVSVSREHAIINLTKQGLFIQSLSHRFGSSILLRKPTQIQSGVKYQIGRSILMFKVFNNFGLFNCCKNKNL